MNRKDENQIHFVLTLLSIGLWWFIWRQCPCYNGKIERTLHHDMNGKPIRIGSCVRFKGAVFEIKRFKICDDGIPRVIFKERCTFTRIVPTEFNIQRVEY